MDSNEAKHQPDELLVEMQSFLPRPDNPVEKNPNQGDERKRKGRKVIITGFVFIGLVIIGMYSAFFYLNYHDPTRSLIYYPKTVTEYKTATGDTYRKVTNIFPSYDNIDFFHEKEAINYKTAQKLLGKPLDISSFRDTYEFSIMQSSSDDPAIPYGAYRYLVYVDGKTTPSCILYVDTLGTVIGVTGPYLVDADFRDITLNGANMAELTRLNNFMTGEDISDPSFALEKKGIYLATAKGSSVKISDRESFTPLYVATFHTTKEAKSISDLIDFYDEDENFVDVEFSTFTGMNAFELYEAILGVS